VRKCTIVHKYRRSQSPLAITAHNFQSGGRLSDHGPPYANWFMQLVESKGVASIVLSRSWITCLCGLARSEPFCCTAVHEIQTLFLGCSVTSAGV